MSKQLRFEDLQPHVDMLIDALENKGASSSGSPYNDQVYVYPEKYRDVLRKIRSKEITLEDLNYKINSLRSLVMMEAGNNQTYRISKIIYAIEIFLRKEYQKFNEL